ncbi:YlxR family protein [Nocardioides sp.]|uniref:YlxR family protein n=1 Tax=Nocardioides sp. TaxID=35761 RepID=UPI002ED3F2E5
MASLQTSPARTPVRTCIGCRERAAKRELLRVVLGLGDNGQPAAVPDPDGTAPGRGAHLHPTTACYDLAVRRRAFARALRAGEGLTGAPVGEYLAAAANTAGTPAETQ